MSADEQMIGPIEIPAVRRYADYLSADTDAAMTPTHVEARLAETLAAAERLGPLGVGQRPPTVAELLAGLEA